MAPWLKYALVGGAVLVVLAAIAAFLVMAFVFSIGTRVVKVKVETRVTDRGGAPAAGCRVVFENDETPGMGRTAQVTDGDGRVAHESHHSEVGSIFLPTRKPREVKLRLYLGAPPRYATFDETETWGVTLRFREPRAGGAVRPEASLARGLFHEEVLFPPPGKAWQQAGIRGLPEAPAGAFAVGELRREREGERDVWRVPLTLALDDAQLAACRAPERAPAPVDIPSDLQRRANALFNEKKWSEALALYREAAARFPEKAWAPLGAGDCLFNLERPKEALPFYEKALALAPHDPEVRYAHANALLPVDGRAAEPEFRRLTAEQPAEARNWVGLGNALYQLDRYGESVAAYEKAGALCATCLSAYDREVLDDARKRAR